MLMLLVHWRHFDTEGLDDLDKVVQEPLLTDESSDSVSQIRKPRKRGRWPPVSMHIWEASTLTHNCYLSCWGIRQASSGIGKKGAGSDRNRVGHLAVQLIFIECPRWAGDCSGHLRCKDKQGFFIIYRSKFKPKHLSQGLVPCLPYSFPGPKPWNTLTFLTPSASMSNLSPGWLNMNKQCSGTARNLIEAPSAWIEVSWTSSFCPVSPQLDDWLWISGPYLNGNCDKLGFIQGEQPEREEMWTVSHQAPLKEPAVLVLLQDGEAKGPWGPFPAAPLPPSLLPIPPGMMPVFPLITIRAKAASLSTSRAHVLVSS